MAGSGNQYTVRIESVAGQDSGLLARGWISAALKKGYRAWGYLAEEGFGLDRLVSWVKWSREGRTDQPLSLATRPDLLVVMDLDLVEHHPVILGVGKDATVVVNTVEPPDRARIRLKMPAGRLICVDGTGFSRKEGISEGWAMLCVLGLAWEGVDQEIISSFASPGIPESVVFRRMQEVRNAAREAHYPPDGCYPFIPYRDLDRTWGWENSPSGGVVPYPGNTVLHEQEPWRKGSFPSWNCETCARCGACIPVCPEGALIPASGNRAGLAGIDYRYCRGCLRCLEVCPAGALVGMAGFHLDLALSASERWRIA